MDRTELESELASAKTSLAHYEAEYEKFCEFKRGIEAELGSRNVTSGDGLRLGMYGYEDWRRKKVQGKMSCERRISQVKKSRTQWHDEVERLKRAINKIDYAVRDQSVVATLQGQLNIAHHEIAALRATILEWESKYRQLDRQYDVVVRELNAVPKALR